MRTGEGSASSGMEKGGMKRLRLRFKDQNVLSVTQKIEGLKRCWFIFNPDDLQTISALASHLVHKFELICSCPNGIVLSMEGYALPPFESTHILQDKDIISVKRKCAVVAEAIDVGGQENSTGDSEPLVKQPTLPGRELLAITEFEEEANRCMNGLAEANDMSGSALVKKKRKRSRQAHGSKCCLLLPNWDPCSSSRLLNITKEEFFFGGSVQNCT